MVHVYCQFPIADFSNLSTTPIGARPSCPPACVARSALIGGMILTTCSRYALRRTGCPRSVPSCATTVSNRQCLNSFALENHVTRAGSGGYDGENILLPGNH